MFVKDFNGSISCLGNLENFIPFRYLYWRCCDIIITIMKWEGPLWVMAIEYQVTGSSSGPPYDSGLSSWNIPTVCCSDVVMIEGFVVLMKCFIDSWEKNKMKCKYVCRVFNVRILRLLQRIKQIINRANTTKHIPSQPFYSLIMDGRPSNEAPSTIASFWKRFRPLCHHECGRATVPLSQQHLKKG